MCGRFLLESDIDDIIASYEYIQSINKNTSLPKGEIFPSDFVPVITQNDEFKLLKWGFPFKNSSKNVINARAESVSEKPFFKNLIKSQRCIIPANSFYEWKNENNTKIKYKISVKNNAIFSFAGIYTTFMDVSGNPYGAFVIITTSANKQMEQIHSRMPVIFGRGSEKAWLHTVSSENLQNTLKPYEDGGLSILPDSGLFQTSFI